MNKVKKYWFKRRRFGYGWVPVTWQGWSVIAAYLAVVLGGALTLSDVPENEFTKEVGIFLVIIFIATAALIRITLLTGPKPKWRWGKKPSDNPNEDW